MRHSRIFVVIVALVLLLSAASPALATEHPGVNVLGLLPKGKNAKAYLTPGETIDASHPDIVAASATALSKLPKNATTRAKHSAIFNYVASRMTYDLDGYMENDHTASAALKRGSGVCLDICVVQTALLVAAGIPSCIIYLKDGDKYHTRTAVYLAEERHWIASDITYYIHLGNKKKYQDVKVGKDKFMFVCPPGETTADEYVSKRMGINIIPITLNIDKKPVAGMMGVLHEGKLFVKITDLAYAIHTNSSKSFYIGRTLHAMRVAWLNPKQPYAPRGDELQYWVTGETSARLQEHWWGAYGILSKVQVVYAGESLCFFDAAVIAEYLAAYCGITMSIDGSSLNIYTTPLDRQAG